MNELNKNSTKVDREFDDLISRQDAIDAINKSLDRETLLYGFVRKVAIDSIKVVPSAQPEVIACGEGELKSESQREERELTITYLEEMKEKYIEGEGYERHPLPEYYALDVAIKALEQESVLDKIRAEIEELDGKYVIEDYATYGEQSSKYVRLMEVLMIINKYKAESEE